MGSQVRYDRSVQSAPSNLFVIMEERWMALTQERRDKIAWKSAFFALFFVTLASAIVIVVAS